MCVCGGSSLTGDLPSAVWPAGVAACVCVLWLFPDQRPAKCDLSGRDCVRFKCVCCLSLTGDLRSVVL